MKKSYLLLAGVALMSAFTACSNDDEMKAVAQAEGTPLVVQSVGVDLVNTKAAIREALFSGTESIGLFIYTDSEGNLSGDYNENTSTSISTTNVPYIRALDGSWSATQPIILSSTEGIVYGYYPYDSDYDGDGTNVEVNVAADQGTGQSDGSEDDDTQRDYMYADPVTGLSNKAYTIAQLTMNHALAMLTFKFEQSTDDGDKYPGEGMVSEIILKNVDNTKSAVKTGTATMNISSGDIDGGQAVISSNPASITISPDDQNTLLDVDENDGSGTELPRMLVYPNEGVAAGDAEVLVTVDGNQYKVAIPALTTTTGWLKGNNYIYTFTLKGTGLEITDVAITEWVEKTGGSGTIQQPL